MSVSTAPTTASGLYADPRVDWLAQYTEEVIDPQRPIVDPHHHLWDRGGQRYLIEELSSDIASGHDIIATVYVEARSMYRAGGPEEMRVVNEVAFANGAAAMSASGGYGPAAICAGIVGHANLLLGDRVKAVLEAEIAAGQGRFRGIRHSSAWDGEAAVASMYATRPKGLLLDATYRKGFACLAPLGLTFDALAVPSAARRLHRSRSRFSGPADRPRSLRRPGRPRPLCRQARGDLRTWKASIQRRRQMPECRGQARRAGDAAARL